MERDERVLAEKYGEIVLNEQAQSVEKMRKALATGRVYIKFKKKDGTTRSATGTTNPEIMQLPVSKGENEPTRSSTNSSTNIRFFDLDIREWRSFTVDNLIKFEPLSE